MEHQSYKDTIGCALLNAEVPEHHQEQMTLIVCLLKTHLFSLKQKLKSLGPLGTLPHPYSPCIHRQQNCKIQSRPKSPLPKLCLVYQVTMIKAYYYRSLIPLSIPL